MTQVARPGSVRSDVLAAGRINHRIGGRFAPGASGREGQVCDAATGQVTKLVDFATSGELGAAVAAAGAAVPAWRVMSLSKRTHIMIKIQDLEFASWPRRRRVLHASEDLHGVLAGSARASRPSSPS